MSDSEGFESADEDTSVSGCAGEGISAVGMGVTSPESTGATSASIAEIELMAPNDSPPATAQREAKEDEPPAVACGSEEQSPLGGDVAEADVAVSSSDVGKHAEDVCAKRIFDRLSEATEKSLPPKTSPVAASSWGGWGKWSTAILSTAVSSVSAFTGQVGEGFNTVLGLGAASADAEQGPLTEKSSGSDAEENAGNGVKDNPVSAVTRQPAVGLDVNVGEGSLRQQNEAVEPCSAVAGKLSESSSTTDWFTQWGVHTITSTVQSGTRSLVSTGLDVLESIGKKTVAVLAESDPGLKKTKSIFRTVSHTPSLSQLLREAKQRGEQPANATCGTVDFTYSDFLEQFQGLAHFEALEMLSQNCSSDVSTLDFDNLNGEVDDAASVLNGISDVFSVDNVTTDAEPAEQPFAGLVEDCIGKLALPISTAKLMQAHTRAGEAGSGSTEVRSVSTSPSSTETKSAAERLYDDAVRSLAELTACALELYHKFGERLLHGDASTKRNAGDYTLVAEEIARLTRIMCSEMTLTSSRFTEKLGTLGDAVSTEKITSVFVEGTKSITYVQDGFCLLRPIVQKAFVAHCLACGR